MQIDRNDVWLVAQICSQVNFVCLWLHNVECLYPSRLNCKSRIVESMNLKQFRILDDFVVFAKRKQLVVVEFSWLELQLYENLQE